MGFGFSRIKDLSSAILFNLIVKADFLPKEDISLLIRTVSGKSALTVEERLSQIPGFVTAEIDIEPKLPWIFGHLPKLSKNITIEILSEK